MSWKSLVWGVVIVALAALTLAYAAPTLMRVTGIDYGIFEYVGRGILAGKLPYSDLYDHKPPAIFYINALGLGLGRGSRWGIWALELASLSLAGLLCASFLRRHFGGLPAALATAAFLLNLTFVHHGGNATEEYALPLQFGALFFLSLWDRNKSRRLYAFLMGACVAVASTLKQPLGALAAGIGAYLILWALEARNRRHFASVVLLAAAGALSVWVGWFTYFALRGVLPEFWEAAFTYNFALSGISAARRLAAMGTALQTLYQASPFYTLGMASWPVMVYFLLTLRRPVRGQANRRLAGVPLLLLGAPVLYSGLFRPEWMLSAPESADARRVAEIVLGVALVALGAVWLRQGRAGRSSEWRDRVRPDSADSLRLPLVVAAVDLPVQLIMISLSGNNFTHYYMSALPSLTVLIASFFWYLSSQPDRGQAAAWTLALSLPVLFVGGSAGLQKMHVSEDRYTRAISRYVAEVTVQGDDVFYWGNLVPVYLESGRRSPSRFFFTDPLFLNGYTDRRHTDVFLRELQAQPPRLILSGSNAERALLYLEEASECSSLAEMDTALALARQEFEGRQVFIPEGMPEVYAWICANYEAEEVVLSAQENWIKTVYHYAPNR